MTDKVTIRLADWLTDEPVLMRIRTEVFVREQSVPPELETDGTDAECMHAMALGEDGTPLGVARMDAGGHIGRVAVLGSWRGRGIGTRLMRFLIDLARRRSLARVYLHAQLSVRSFYDHLGFAVRGAEFEEAGIRHVEMTMDLSDGQG